MPSSARRRSRSTPGLPARWSKSPSTTISASGRGQLLFQIDPEPYQIAVDQAEARLGSARLQIDELKATYRQQLAELQSAKDSADFDEREYGATASARR